MPAVAQELNAAVNNVAMTNFARFVLDRRENARAECRLIDASVKGPDWIAAFSPQAHANHVVHLAAGTPKMVASRLRIRVAVIAATRLYDSSLCRHACGGVSMNDYLCDMISRADLAKRHRTRTLLQENPHILPETVARHYMMLATTAAQMQQCLNARRAGAQGMEEAIEHYLESLRRRYIEDFGTEPNWRVGLY